MPTPLISVHGITKSYGAITAIDDVSFSIYPGEILGLIGPNGAGKTTLFECIAGTQPADCGEVSVEPDAGNRASVLFYIPDAITPWADQPVAWVLDFCVGFFQGRRELRSQIVEELGLAPLLNKAVGALSKGQRKRVLIAIGLLAPQPAVLIDEPFDGLDLRQSRELESVFRRHADAGRTLFLSIHHIASAARVCDRFVLLSSGCKVAEGTLADLRAQAAPRANDAATESLEELFLALT